MINVAEAPRKRPTKEPVEPVLTDVLTDEELEPRTSALIATFRNSRAYKNAVLLSGDGHELHFSFKSVFNRNGYRRKYSVDFFDNQQGCTLDVERKSVISPQIGSVTRISVSASLDKNSIEYSSKPPFKKFQTQRNTDSAYQNAAGFLKHF